MNDCFTFESHEKEKTEKMKDEIIRKAKEESRKIIKGAKEESENIVGDLRQLSVEIGKEQNKRIQEAQDKLKNNLDDVERDLSENLLKVKSNKPPKNLLVGETVEILSLNQFGTVLNLPDENGNVNVQVGIMKVNVPLNTLKRTKDEIDLRGETLDEALLDLDKYLDDAYIAGLKEVYIIHGKGTGVLREGIGSLLKGHKHISSFRLGLYGEGGNGVTIAELK